MEIFKWRRARGYYLRIPANEPSSKTTESRFPDLHRNFCRMPAEKAVLHDNGCPLVGYHVKSIVEL